MSRGTLDPARSLSVSLTRLSRSPVLRPRRFRYSLRYGMRSATPERLLSPVWPLPRSLATTKGISVDVFSSPYLDVSVQAVPLIYLCIQYMIHRHDSVWVAPFGYLRFVACLQLSAAFRSLPRPSSAPGAKAFALRPL